MGRPKKRKNQPISNIKVREALATDIEAFLASGQKIQMIPNGVSGQIISNGRKASSG